MGELKSPHVHVWKFQGGQEQGGVDPAPKRIWRSLLLMFLGCAATSLSGMRCVGLGWGRAAFGVEAEWDEQAEPSIGLMVPCSSSTTGGP